jgi:hypothetical protein
MRFSTLILLAGSVTAAFATPTANCKTKTTSSVKATSTPPPPPAAPACITDAQAQKVAFLYGQTVGNFSLAVADEVL